LDLELKMLQQAKRFLLLLMDRLNTINL
jgi:hypothetical protein